MDYKNLFEKFDGEGKLLLPDAEVLFAEIPWCKHPTFDGVELKHIITSEKTGRQFSYHLDNKSHIIYCKNIESSVLKALCNLLRWYTELYKLPTGCLQEKQNFTPGDSLNLITNNS